MNASSNPQKQQFAATLLPSTCVRDVLVDTYVKRADHFDFSLTIVGRTRFLHAIFSEPKYVRYKKVARYSALAELHKALGAELAPYLKAAGRAMPEFPAKTWFGCDRKLAEKRVILFNRYFAELFDEYGTVLLYSPSLIDFFEPTRMDLSIIGETGEESKEFVRSLALLVSSFEVTQADSHKVCQFGIKGEIPTLMGKLREKPGMDWERYIPFDMVHDNRLFRVDVQNLYSDGAGVSDEWLNLYQTPYSVCIIAFSLARRKTYLRIKELLGNIKLVLLEGKRSVPPFVVVGLGHENAKHEVAYDEIANYMMDLYGDPCPYPYMEVSYTSGRNVMEAIRALADETIKRDKDQSPQ